MGKRASAKVLFIGTAAVIACGLLSPPLALAGGIAFGMSFTHPFERESRTWAKRLLQLSVVALGFGINFGEVVKAGRASFAYTALESLLRSP